MQHLPDVTVTESGNLSKLRVVMDLRERNKNTRKLSSLMPNMDGILRHVAGKKY